MCIKMEDLIKYSLEKLNYLEHQQGSCSASLNDQIKNLKIELKFLRTYFFIYDNLMSWSLELIHRNEGIEAAIVEHVVEVILSLGSAELPTDLDRLLFSVQEKIELVKLQVHQSYRIGASSIVLDIEADLQVKCIDSVLENMKDLIQSGVNSIVKEKKLLNTLEGRLRFLTNSLQFFGKLQLSKSDLQDLTGEAGLAATNAAWFLFSLWMNKMDENSDLYHKVQYNICRETGRYRTTIEASSDGSVSLLVDFIDLLLQQLAELLSSDGRSVEIPTKDHFESLALDLKLVRFLLTNANPHPDYAKLHLQHVGAQLNKVSRLILELHVCDMNEEMMSMDDNILLPSLGGRELISFLCMDDLLNDETSSIAPIKDQLEILSGEIRLLRTFYVETQNGDHFDQECKYIHNLMVDMALEAGSAIYSFRVNEDKQGMVKKISSLLPDLLEKTKLIKVDMRKIYSPAASSNFRETCSLRGTTNSLKELNVLLIHRASAISSFVKPHIEKAAKLWMGTLQNELQFLISFLDDSEEQWIAIEELEALEMRITNMANEVNYATDPISLRDESDYPSWYHMLKFSTLMEEVKLIKKEIEIINQMILAKQSSAMREVVVGFEDEAKNIIEQLIGGTELLNIVSIIGMGGLGKTTLTKKLYNDPSIVEYFHVRAWCCISQVFQERQVLLYILDQIVELSEGTYQTASNADLKDILRRCLKRRRYLIIIDDIWDIKAWTALSGCFEDDSNGSRIVFTTRLQKIAKNVKARSVSYSLRTFTDDESFDLLQHKLFHGRRCPKEQVKNLKKIAKGCNGLPFAVVLVAGVLSRKREEEWEQVEESLILHTGGDLSMGVSELSYKNLPEDLKSCFLYLGMFPEDREILAKKLMWLWDAEGFTQKTKHQNSVDVAEKYLMDLIDRSLVVVAERGSNGGIKTIRFHDLLRSFSLAKAKEKKFLFLPDGNVGPFAPTELKFHQKVDGNLEPYNSNSATYEHCRLCIYSMPNDIVKFSSNLHVCSLLHFAPSHLDTTSPYDASFIFGNFNLLNVLDLGRLQLKDLNCGIELLVQLRLLAVQIQSTSIPSSIANLKNLETFLVKGLRGEVEIPSTLWSIVTLRHLHIDNRSSLIWEKNDIKDAILDKLETLSTPVLCYGAISTDIIRSLFKLQKLKCIFTEFWSNTESCNVFPELDTLIQLKSLKVSYNGRKEPCGRFTFPSNLKKLTLSKFCLPWSDIATIATLRNLEVLKLLFRAFDGKEWDTRDGEFLKLKYLKLESLDIEQWHMSSEDHFPILEKLVVHRCKNLEEIPSNFGGINTLQMIEVKWCNGSAANSAREIYQQRLEDMEDEGFKVIIHQGFTSSS